ncbi:MAG: OsmC family protein [Acidobacteriia bacterium]|nr:OsmC family protein [Terriglobia bacterium]
MVQAKVRLNFPATRQFTMETGSGHHLIIDDAVGHTGPKPIELLAGALAGCTAFDVITVLTNKKHQDVSAYEVSVDAEQRQSPPQVFTTVHIHHTVTGRNIDARAVEDAIHLSENKYCSVGAMVQKSGAEIRTTYSIRDLQNPFSEEVITLEPALAG